MSAEEDVPEWCPNVLMNKDVMLGLGNNSDSSNVNSGQTVLYDIGYDPLDESMNSYGKRSEESSESSDSDTSLSPEDPNSKVLTFKNGTDVNTIPIQKDGMAVCQKCGAIGVKHAFYSKSKRFCSLACSRSYAILQREGKPIPKPKPIFKFPLAKVKVMKKSNSVKQEVKETSPSLAGDLPNTFTWEPYLACESFSSAMVSSFKHSPLSECWDTIMVGMKVEVENRDYGDLKELFPESYWVASVVRVAGYKALLRFEGFGTDGSEDFWLNLCKPHVQPVGWCASQGKPLIPPRSIQHKYHDWKEFLVKRLTGARTVPADFHEKVAMSLTSRFKVGMQLEVVNKDLISSMCVAYVEQVVGGRLHVRYVTTERKAGFWCHERSLLIHPLGWSQLVGHNINTTTDFARASLQKVMTKEYSESDASWDIFYHPEAPQTTAQFKDGMKLEAIDPLNLSTICVATVCKVLKNNYLMIGIDGYNEKGGPDWFCHHATSFSIFPAGFCELNDIELTPPRGYKGEFKWIDYLKANKAVAAPVSLFNRELPNHGFRVGMRLEAVDLMQPALICVGTIAKVVGRLLRVHFDGWDVSYDQWCDCESPDLYPVGWCEMVDYHLEPPRSIEPVIEKKRKVKTPVYRKPRKKKKAKISPPFSSRVKQEHVSVVRQITWTRRGSDSKEFKTNRSQVEDSKQLRSDIAEENTDYSSVPT